MHDYWDHVNVECESQDIIIIILSILMQIVCVEPADDWNVSGERIVNKFLSIVQCMYMYYAHTC